MRTMDRRDFIKVFGTVVGATVILPPSAWGMGHYNKPSEVTPNPSLVDMLDWVPESDAIRIVSDYDANIETPKKILSALFSLLDPNNTSFSEIPRQVGMLRDFQLKEIQEIPKEKIDGLYNLVHLSQQYYDKFKETFGAILKTGDSPEDIINNGLPVKIFNPYVEALYWLALDDKVSYAENIVNNFDHKMLLSLAWPKPKDKGDTKEEKRIYKERWGKFGTVMERLGTTPLTLDRYLDRIKYVGGKYTNTPWEVFKKQKAECISASYFGEEALNKHGGFTTFMRHVAWGPWGTLDKQGSYMDHCGLGIVLNDKRLLLVVSFNKAGNRITGPYDGIPDVDNRLAQGNTIIDRMWGSYFKPGLF